MVLNDFLEKYGLKKFEDFFIQNPEADFRDYDYYETEEALVDRLNGEYDKDIKNFNEIPYKIDLCVYTVQDGYNVYYISERLYDYIYIERYPSVVDLNDL